MGSTHEFARSEEDHLGAEMETFINLGLHLGLQHRTRVEAIVPPAELK
jgi:hypothetical protein